MKAGVAAALVLVHAANATAANVCDRPAARAAVSAALARNASPLTPASLNQAMGNAHVLMVGDLHYTMRGERYAQVIQTFAQAKGPSACVGLEMTARGKTGREVIKFYDWIIDGVTKLEADKAKAENRAPVTPGIVTLVTRLKGFFEPMVAAAERAGLRSFPADHPNHPWIKDLKVTKEERNRAMALFISKALVEEKCSSVLYIVGKSHLTAVNEMKTSLQDLLKPGNIRTVTVNMQLVNDPPGNLQSIKCPMPKISQMQLVPSAGLFAPDLEMFPDVPGMTYAGFDYTLFVPYEPLD